MKICLLAALLFFNFDAHSAIDFGELNLKSGEALGEKSVAQNDLNRLLIEKMGDDWGFSETLIRSSVKSLVESKYSIEFSSDKSCNPWPELLEEAEYRSTLEEQVNQTAAFLSDYHARNLGNNRSLFKIRHIKLCTAGLPWDSKMMEFDRFKSELRLNIGPTRLRTVGNGSLTRNNLNFLTAKQIKAKWDAGEMWESETYLKDLVDRKKNPVRVFWPFLNPVSEERVFLREAIRRDGLKLADAVRNWIHQDDLSLQKGLLATASKFKDGADLSARIQKLSGLAAFNLGQSWADKLADGKAAEDMATAVLVSVLKKHVEKQKQISIERKQYGLVNVENFHDIDVDFTTGDAQAFQEQVVVPENIEIKVTQVGVVNVSTTDRVSVGVALSAMASGNTFEKAAFAVVLKNLKEE